MLDVVYVGLTVVFFLAVVAVVKGVVRLGGPEAPSDAEAAPDLTAVTGAPEPRP